MNRMWKLRELENHTIDLLCKNIGCSPIFARLLALRGLTEPAKINSFLDPESCDIPDPFEFNEMEAAVDRIFKAVENGEKVIIHGDYDVDGITSTAIVKETLDKLGLEADCYLPDRMGDGYGLNIDMVRSFADQYNLMITVDCGTTACEAIDIANQNGLDVIVTDHHDPGEQRPNAIAVLNPMRPEENYPSKCLSGAGVAWKLCSALRKRGLRVFDEDEQLELVALGMVADVMPLLDENRILLRRAMKQFTKMNRPGLSALMEQAKVFPNKITPHSIGFQLGPRINAAGRMDHPKTALDLLLTDQEEQSKILSEKLDELNRFRRQIETKIFSEACALIDKDKLNDRHDKLLVVVGDNWHRGILGILAQRLSQRYQKSVFLLSKEEEIAIGSARAVDGADLIPLLENARSHSISCGGHTAAAGMKVKPENLKNFTESLYQGADLNWKSIDTPPLWLDAEVMLEQINFDFVNEFKRMEPFGQGNNEPLFYAKASISPAGPRIVGNGHLKIAFQHPRGVLNGIGFGQGQKIESLNGGDVEIAFHCRFNDFNGHREISLHLEDIRPYRSQQSKVIDITSTRNIFTRQTLGEIYKILLNASDEQKQIIHQYAYLFAKKVKMTDKEFDTALSIFSELNLLTLKEGKIQMLDVEKKRDLKESSTFRQVSNGV